MPTFRCALYCKLGAKYSARHPVYPMWTVVPVIYNAFTAPYIQCFNIQLNVSALQFQISRQFNVRYTANLVPNTAHILQFTLCELWSRPYTMHFHLHIFRLQYSMERIFSAIGYNRTFRSPLSCKLGAKYSAHHPFYAMSIVVPDIYNVITARVFRLQYSADRICAAISDIATIQCALYCKLGVKFSSHPADYASWNVVQVIYNVITARHVQASIFKWTYRGCYWRYLHN
jgi:hypothetical protein